MKHLKIEVNGQEWVNGDFTEVTFTDGPTGVKIEGKAARSIVGGGGGGTSLLELFANATKARTAEVVEEKKAGLAAEQQVIEAEPGD